MQLRQKLWTDPRERRRPAWSPCSARPARRRSSNRTSWAAVGVWATSTRPGAMCGSPIAATPTSTRSGGGGAAVELACAVLEALAALVLDVAQELGVLAVGGDGEPANHVLEAGERALVAVVASPRTARRRSSNRTSWAAVGVWAPIASRSHWPITP